MNFLSLNLFALNIVELRYFNAALRNGGPKKKEILDLIPEMNVKTIK
jgi:hypothetical protein